MSRPQDMTRRAVAARRTRWACVALGMACGSAAEGSLAAAQLCGGPVSIAQVPVGGGAAAAASSSARWRFDIAPYLWASGVKGTVGVRNRTAGVDVSFWDIIENLDFALMLPGEVRRGRWGIAGEVIYLGLSKSKATPGPAITSAEFELSQLMLEASPRYRVLDRVRCRIDVLAGVRFVSLKPKLTLVPAAELQARRSWADPIVGARFIADLASRWLVQLRGDIGGFGIASDFTWQALALTGYEISDRVSVFAGYRYLDFDFSDDNDGFLYDVATRGPVLGVNLSF